jgi:hypothetical protein
MVWEHPLAWFHLHIDATHRVLVVFQKRVRFHLPSEANPIRHGVSGGEERENGLRESVVSLTGLKLEGQVTVPHLVSVEGYYTSAS